MPVFIFKSACPGLGQPFLFSNGLSLPLGEAWLNWWRILLSHGVEGYYSVNKRGLL